MTQGAQQKLLICLKDTAAALAAYRATSLEHEELILQKLTDAILPPAKLTWNAAVETAEFQQPSMGARRGVGTASLTWRTLRAFLRCYDNPHGKDEMEQRLTNWTWGNTIPETQATFNELVDIWTQLWETNPEHLRLHRLRLLRPWDRPRPTILVQCQHRQVPVRQRHRWRRGVLFRPWLDICSTCSIV